MSYIESGKSEGATVHLGGDRFGSEGYFINPTIFTDTTPDMKIVQEEIFGPVGVVIKFEDEEDVIRQANDTGASISIAELFLSLTKSRFDSLWSCGGGVQSEHHPRFGDCAQTKSWDCLGMFYFRLCELCRLIYRTLLLSRSTVSISSTPTFPSVDSSRAESDAS